MPDTRKVITIMNSSKIDKLEKYFRCIPNEYEKVQPSTIESLAKEMSLPVTVVRTDISDLFDSAFACLTVDYEFEDNEAELDKSNAIDIYDELMEDECLDESTLKETLRNAFLSGQLDYLPLRSCLPYLTEGFSIPLSMEEYNVMESYLNDMHTKGDSFDGTRASTNYSDAVPFKIKKSYKFVNDIDSLQQLLEGINNAINIKKQIEFEYISPNSVSSEYRTVTPVKIIYDNETNKYSLLATYRRSLIVFNLENINPKSLDILSQPAAQYDIDKINQKAPHVWKNAFSETTPTHVKVRFSDKVYESVRKDLAYRNPELTLSKPDDDGYFYFEDSIYGLDAFDQWIRGYGSSALILKPEFLALQRMHSIVQTLDKYNA